MPGEWRTFCSALGDQVHLSSGFHPQTHGQTERLNQALEAALCWVAFSNLTSLSYVHIHLPPRSIQSVSRLLTSLVIGPWGRFGRPLSTTSSAAESPSVKQSRAALLWTTELNQRLADRQRVSAFPRSESLFVLKKDSTYCKSLYIFSPYKTDSVISPSAVLHELLPSFRIHLAFSAKPVSSSPLICVCLLCFRGHLFHQNDPDGGDKVKRVSQIIKFLKHHYKCVRVLIFRDFLLSAPWK